MTETFTTVAKDTVPTLTSKFDIKPTDVVLTDSKRIAEILINEGAKPKSLFYANRAALNDELIKYKGDVEVKVVLEWYSENTIKFIKENKINAVAYYRLDEDSVKIGRHIDGFENRRKDAGLPIDSPITHRYI